MKLSRYITQVPLRDETGKVRCVMSVIGVRAKDLMVVPNPLPLAKYAPEGLVGSPFEIYEIRVPVRLG